MLAHDRFRHLCTAVAFALAMLVLGLMNPNAAPGRMACGLVCSGPVANSPLAPFAGQ
jgi:hypothetical protein